MSGYFHGFGLISTQGRAASRCMEPSFGTILSPINYLEPPSKLHRRKCVTLNFSTRLHADLTNALALRLIASSSSNRLSLRQLTRAGARRHVLRRSEPILRRLLRAPGS